MGGADWCKEFIEARLLAAVVFRKTAPLMLLQGWQVGWRVQSMVRVRQRNLAFHFIQRPRTLLSAILFFASQCNNSGCALELALPGSELHACPLRDLHMLPLLWMAHVCICCHSGVKPSKKTYKNLLQIY